MPICGSQIIFCDVPIRFDMYKGCSHLCEYCFVQRKSAVFDNIKPIETTNALKMFIEGARTENTRWCDWDIPLHWGGMSDPFQPIEKKYGYSLEALKIFAETKYPFIVSTKNKMIAEEPYLSLIKQCNCVVQFSAACPAYNSMEKGASTFEERLAAAAAISPYKRVVIRCQPYIPQYFEQIKQSIDLFHKAGVYGVIFEGIKYLKKAPGTFQLRNDFVYPSALYKKHFSVFKEMLHEKGMKFYCGENRLRAMGDSLCCCGIDGLGWHENTANLNHLLYDKENFKFTDKMYEIGTAGVFKSICQSAISSGIRRNSYKEFMTWYTKDLSAVSALIPDETLKKIKERIKKQK